VLNKLKLAIQSNLSTDLLKKEYRNNSHPMTGHCYIAAEAAFHLLGKKNGWKSYVLPKKVLNVTHWWLQKGKDIFDPTAEQFDFIVPYDQGKSCGFLTKRPSKRAKILLKRIKKDLI
jgi:hypothetical protein